METKSKIAQLWALKNELYDFIKVNPEVKEAVDLLYKVSEERDKLIASLPEPINISFHGNSEDLNISFRDIDDDLKKKFKGDIQTDSESSGFFVYCKSKIKKDVSNFLDENYPQLEYSYQETDPMCPYFINMTEAVKYCEENKIKFDIPEDLYKKAKEIKIKNIKNKISDLQKELEELVN
jgi:hypothetical protein